MKKKTVVNYLCFLSLNRIINLLENITKLSNHFGKILSPLFFRNSKYILARLIFTDDRLVR